jgi:para-nitrobenzyl esterase
MRLLSVASRAIGKKLMRTFALALAVLLIGLGACTASKAQTNPEVTIDTGMLIGRAQAGVQIFRGIPFAAPPVGALRWSPPRPALTWEGKRDASDFGAPCMQPPFPGISDDLKPFSEDCLTLNIWKPDGNATGLPVMVWIHGGGHAIGSGSEKYYEGSALARRGVIVVTINYRLGRLGFFAHPALLQEAAGRGEPAGNYGMMDQVAALKWVQKNIGAFGGDPNRVTIFGESGGGRSVNWLMTMPSSKGLFVGAISQSGRGMEPLRGMVSQRFGMAPMAEIDARVVTRLGLGTTTDSLRAAAASTFIPPYQQLMAEGFGPFIDGSVLQGDPAVLFAQGKQHDVPFMIGVNSWEANMFVASNPRLSDFLDKFGQLRAEAARLYGAGIRSDGTVLTAMFQDSVYNITTHVLASGMSTRTSPAYAYYFDHVPAFKRSSVPGAAHGAEIPYVFDTFNLARNAARYTAEDAQVARTMGDYWVAFAKTGNPNGSGRVDWPRYVKPSNTIMTFKSAPMAVDNARQPFIEFQERRINAIFGLQRGAAQRP